VTFVLAKFKIPAECRMSKGKGSQTDREECPRSGAPYQSVADWIHADELTFVQGRAA
jgi:hypothetical protein